MNIRELFAQRKNGDTYATLAARAQTMTAQRLQQIATTQPKEFPSVDGVRAVARALRVREVTVVMAFAESLGLDSGASKSRIALAMPPSAERLTDEQLAALAHFVQTITKGEPANESLPWDEREKLMALVDREHGLTPVPDYDPERGKVAAFGVVEAEVLSDDADTDDDLVAAHEEEGSISGEQEQPDTP